MPAPDSSQHASTLLPMERRSAARTAVVWDALRRVLAAVPEDFAATGAAYTVGNAHKWLCAPKGAGFLHVRRDRQGGLHPTSISHGYEPDAAGPRFLAEFDWTGTDDPTPWLTIPDCLRWLGSRLPGGWPGLMQRNNELALEARRRAEAAGIAGQFATSRLFVDNPSWTWESLASALDELYAGMAAQDQRNTESGPGSWVYYWHDFGLASIRETVEHRRSS